MAGRSALHRLSASLHRRPVSNRIVVIMILRTALPSVAAAAALTFSAVAAQSSPEEKAKVPDPPAIFARVGEKAITTYDLELELNKRLEHFNRSREKIIEAGGWREADQKNFERLNRPNARRSSAYWRNRSVRSWTERILAG